MLTKLNKNNMGKKILVVVDVQYDFCNPNGALFVPGGEEVVNKVKDIIPNFDYVIFTKDSHGLNHCSFKENGGIWPVHCVWNSIGEGIPVELLKAAKDYGVVTKGGNVNEEEYGADANAIMTAHDENPEECEFVFCGIHALYCVKETIKNFIEKYPQVKVSVLTDCIAPLDCDEFNTFCAENSITQKSVVDF